MVLPTAVCANGVTWKKLPTRIATRGRLYVWLRHADVIDEMEPALLLLPPSMRFAWLIPLSVFLVGAGMFLRARHRANYPRSLTSEPVSGQWLAERRGREEHTW